MILAAARKTISLLLVVAFCASDRFTLPARAWAEDTVSSTDAAQHFDTTIAPLLARRCLDCHNPTDEKGDLDLTSRQEAFSGGDSGPTIVPGKLDESLLWSRVEAGEMPPKHPLSPDERQLLRDWIAAGAHWSTETIDRFRYTSDARAGYDWWSLQPVVRPVTPNMEVAALGAQNPIDHFLAAPLAQHQLAAAPEADRRTLIRRLTFDLTGLPPTPEEVGAFLADDAPDAYERLVDKLLSSPQYGVRWARHWLDIVRFGESNGFEYDEFRPHAWPYRDWVVSALNDDLPYDEFTRLQIAGDVIHPESLDANVATGFLAAGAYDTAGQGQQSAAMRAVVRQDEMEDLVGTVAQTFLGLTVNCARCHDHKFDPIRQAEYYGLVAALSGTRQANRDVAQMTPRAAVATELARLTAERQELRDELAALEQPAREAILAHRATHPAELHPVATWDFPQIAANQSTELPITLHGAARLTEQGLELGDETAFATSAPLSKPLHAKTLEAWVRLNNLAQRGGAAISVQSLDGGVFDAIVFGEREPKRWMSGSNNYTRTQSFHAPEEGAALDEIVHLCISYAEDGTIAAYRNGQPYGKPYQAGGTATFAAEETQVVFGLRHGAAAPGKMLLGTIQRAKLYDRALSAEEIASGSDRQVTEAMIREQLSTAAQQRYVQLRARIEATTTALSRLHPAQVYAIKPKQPEPTHLLARGNPAQPKEVLPAGGIQSLRDLPAEFGLTPDAPEADCRRRLAEWIVDARNPLFARVMVNRLWHYHFGVGLVDTPNDFGFNGGRPTNQALLDWLASEFVASGYKLKTMHRLIVTSAAYRRSARANTAALQIDADNRLLWRKTPQRLEAEAVRDALLHVAGVLDLSIGGPGFQELKMTIAPGTNTFLYEPDDPTRTVFKRRTLYRVWARSGRSPLLDVLDCPDPSTTSPRRAITTTPLQALALMNNAFVLHVVDLFAARLAREAGDDPARQVSRAYELAYGREASPDEQALAEQILREHGAVVLARALINSNEFLYVD